MKGIENDDRLDDARKWLKSLVAPENIDTWYIDDDERWKFLYELADILDVDLKEGWDEDE